MSTAVDIEAIVAWLNGDGLRVSPASHVVHTASCRTQDPFWAASMLPWPEFDHPRDRPCKTCKPDLGPHRPPAAEETR